MEYAILIVMWKDLLDLLDKTNEKLQTPNLEMCEGYIILSLFDKGLKENSDKILVKYEKINKSKSEINRACYSATKKWLVIKTFQILVWTVFL